MVTAQAGRRPEAGIRLAAEDRLPTSTIWMAEQRTLLTLSADVTWIPACEEHEEPGHSVMRATLSGEPNTSGAVPAGQLLHLLVQGFGDNLSMDCTFQELDALVHVLTNLREEVWRSGLVLDAPLRER